MGPLNFAISNSTITASLAMNMNSFADIVSGAATVPALFKNSNASPTGDLSDWEITSSSHQSPGHRSCRQSCFGRDSDGFGLLSEFGKRRAVRRLFPERHGRDLHGDDYARFDCAEWLELLGERFNDGCRHGEANSV